MRTFRFGILAMLTMVSFLTSCTVYQYTGRQTDIRNRGIDGTEQRAGIKVDYNKRVTATSNYEITRSDAINEAEFLCIQEQKIDVVVDPVFKIEYNPLKMKKKFKATIIGFAGMYEERPTLLDESKKYTIDDIEKFKLMYDPSFLDYYYRQPQPQGGDTYNYYIKSGVNAAPAKGLKAPKAQPAAPKSIMLKNDQPARPFTQYSSEEMRRAKQLRDGGISAIVCGAAVCLGVGLTTFATAGEWGCDCEVHYPGTIAGSVLMAVGAASFIAGIPMVTVGAVRYNKGKKSQFMDITLNASSNGLGLGMTF